MKEKRVLVIFLFLTLLLSVLVVFAQDDKEISKSYDCLKRQLKDNCGDTQNVIQASFNLLAGAYDSSIQGPCITSLNNKKKTDCWPDSTNSAVCTIKSTAIAILALKYTNSNVDDSIAWLKTKKKLATDLTWFLEIDSINATTCSINGQTIYILDNKKLSGTDPQGLSKAYGNYWYQINDLTKNYTISCNSSFVTTLIYKKPVSGIYYVSSETHSAAASDSTNEFVNGYCFSTSERCEYEGTLWAALAMLRAGEDISPFVPYLTAMADETANSKYLPYTFLYMLDGTATDYLAGFLSLQKQNKYWEVSGNKFYDTSVALLALQSGTYQESTNAKSYLMTQRTASGDNDGCWPSDTAFILYSAWPKSPALGGGGTSNRDCESFNYSCTSRSECSLDNTLTNFDCTSLAQVCCSVRPVQLSCQEKDGIECKDGEECSGSIVVSSDSNACCIGGSCQKIETSSECEDNDGFCRTQCTTGQEEKDIFSSSCQVGEKCCTTKKTTGPNWWLIILLIMLIILVILAIIFRNQLKIWWFRMKTGMKSKKGPEPTTRPSTPPYTPSRPPIMTRQIIPRQPPARTPPQRPPQRLPQGRPPATPARAQKDKEFEDTMKKLKDMSK